MARLLLKHEGAPDQVIELRLGVNRFGRAKGNDFQIDHATISSRHCEMELAEDGILIRDCDSTNGTFINGEPIESGKLLTGQTLHLGDVELLVENTEVMVAIPKIEVPHPAPPPIVLTDGALVCPRHPKAKATHQCTHCREVMCDACVHRLRRRGGKLHKLCPLCSHDCEPLGGEKKKKKSILGFLQKTVKLPFMRLPRSDE